MEESKKISQSRILTSFEQKIQHFFNCSIKSDLPSAIWRLPKQESVQAICQLDNDQIDVEEIETCPKGFIFHPYQESERHKRQFIRADLRFEQESGEIKQNESFTGSQRQFDQFIESFENQDRQTFRVGDYLEKYDARNSSESAFKELVISSKAVIADGQFQKIVPSRCKSFNLKDNFHPVIEFFKLCEAYENAFVSLVFLPNHGVWLGATPELLIAVDQNKTFKTVSLAGTQQIPEDYDLSHAAWTQKEIEEQALVSRYVINCFKQIRLREFEEYGPKTVKAGNLIHLKTEFTVDMEEVNFPQLGTVMLDLLHPTSAVCGMPMIPSMKFLADREGYDRQYYSGYLGPTNIEDNTSLFVNLRCMKVFKNSGLLFAGAGVTEDSDPTSELQETEMKFRTLLNVIES